MLKGIVKHRLGSDMRDQVVANFSSSNAISQQPSFTTSTSGGSSSNSGPLASASVLHQDDYGLMTAIRAAQRSFVITDPTLPDNPIIFASKGFLELTGYSLEEVLGRNCRFMQGPGSDLTQVDVLRKGINDGVDTSICILNYRADGTSFYNQIFVAALRDVNDKIINYVGVQVEVSRYTILYHLICHII